MTYERPDTWRKLITEAMDYIGEDWSDVVAMTLTAEQLDVKFDAGYGGAEGVPFTLWTKERVYFPVTYDGAESVGSAPRNPCDEACRHVGGE